MVHFRLCGSTDEHFLGMEAAWVRFPAEALHADEAQVDERLPCKQEEAGSNPVVGSPPLFQAKVGLS
jgi:hypothetical protein